MTAIEDAGYRVPAEPVTFMIDGMTCASSVSCVERALLAVPGVQIGGRQPCDGTGHHCRIGG